MTIAYMITVEIPVEATSEEEAILAAHQSLNDFDTFKTHAVADVVGEEEEEEEEEDEATCSNCGGVLDSDGECQNIDCEDCPDYDPGDEDYEIDEDEDEDEEEEEDEDEED
jgi:hypothetical protein